MTDKSVWIGASGSQVLQQGHQAHATRAIELVGYIGTNVQSVSAGLSILLEKAKTERKKSPQLKPFIDSLEELLKQLNEQLSSEVLNKLRGCVVALLCKLQQQDNSIEELKADKKNFQEKIDKLKEELRCFQEDRRKVMLCQVAYTLDRAACECVYGHSCEFRTLKDIASNYEDNYDMSPQQAKNFEKFCAFIKQKGLDINKLLTVLRPLRRVRREPAHGRPEELEAVTAQQLLQWASDCRVPQRNLQDVLPLLQHFTQPEKPLVLLQDVSNVIQ